MQGAGRTDAGVHARGQVAAFTTESDLMPETFVKAMNSYLPPDVAVKDACYVDIDFDPRRDASSREYRYTILNSQVRSPASRRWAYTVPKKLNIEAMKNACSLLEGEHDFSPFTNNEGGLKNTIRSAHRVEVSRRGNFILFEMEAKAFLPQQVRRTAGLLIEVGTGEKDLAEFREIAFSGEIGKARKVVPPHGLCLTKVNYFNIRFNDEDI